MHRLGECIGPVQVEMTTGGAQEMMGRFFHDGPKFLDEMALIVISTLVDQFRPVDSGMRVENAARFIKSYDPHIHFGAKAHMMEEQPVDVLVAVVGMHG